MPKEVKELFEDGPVVLFRKKFVDQRGSFEMIFQNTEFQKVFPQIPELVQTNAIWALRGALRGVHSAPLRENHWKVVTCVHGSVRDAVVDLRAKSPSFGELRTIDILADAPATLIIPPGFGHAVQGLSPESIVVYGSNVEYSNNKEFEINPINPRWVENWRKPIILSARDELAPSFAEFQRRSDLNEEIE
jgi:dTDP-4-dehydrorhamnose 3,5-epimerase